MFNEHKINENKRKIEYQDDDFVFNKSKRSHISPDVDLNANLYEFEKNFEELKKYVTLFNRYERNKKNKYMEIEKKSNSKEKIKNAASIIPNLESETKIIKSNEFGKINNITN
jgi:hypothetical protein